MIELFDTPPANDLAHWWSFLLACMTFAVWLVGAIFVTVSGHELGHVIFGKLAGYSFERISFGSGRRLFSFRIGGTLIELNLGILDGHVLPRHAKHPDSGFCQILLSLGGMLANVAMMSAAVIAWLLVDMSTSARLGIVWFALCNAAYILLSLYPYTARDSDGQYYEMDAYQIIRTWRLGPRRSDQDNYMAMVTPFFTEEFEPAPSRAAREIVKLVTDMRSAAWRGAADTASCKQSLVRLLDSGRLTKPEKLLIYDTLARQDANYRS